MNCTANDRRAVKSWCARTPPSPVHKRVDDTRIHMCWFIVRSFPNRTLAPDTSAISFDMADPNSLVSLFENCTLDDVPDRHVLEIEFPVRGLLPDFLPSDCTPLLMPPVSLNLREAPPEDRRKLNVFQSSCRIHLQKIEDRKPPKTHAWTSLQDAFRILTCGPGHSHLQAVAFYDPEMEKQMVRVFLHITLKQDANAYSYDFEFTLKEWQHIVNEGGCSCVNALDKIMTRRTDRAYYHVRNRLACDYGWEFAKAEEARWIAQWGGNRLRELEREDTSMEEIDKSMEAMGL
jgi:hypothetical protein